MKVLCGYDSIKKVLAENAKLPEPMLRDAKVLFDYDVVQDPGSIPKFLVDKDSVRLELPEVTNQVAERLPEKFEMLLQSPVEDVYARAGTIQFKFNVQIKGREQNKNGTVKLDYDATVGEIKDVSRA